MAAVVVGGGIAFFGFTKKWLDKLSPPETKAKPGDAVVVSGAFADAKPVMELVAEVRKLRAVVDELLVCTKQSNAIHRGQSDSIDGLSDQVRRLVRVEMEKS